MKKIFGSEDQKKVAVCSKYINSVESTVYDATQSTFILEEKEVRTPSLQQSYFKHRANYEDKSGVRNA